VNIAGGMNVEEPAADLSVVAAVASSVRNRALSPSTAVFGEVGLSGEIRGIPQAALRVREAMQMGFTRVVLPAANVDPGDMSLKAEDGELVGVRTVGEALDELIP
jgi:DNA repair protein RadA/Sms